MSLLLHQDKVTKEIIKMKKTVALAMGLAACVAAAGALGGCGETKEDNTLVIGITIYAPMNYYENDDESGKLIGFDTEFAEKACAELGYTPKFQVIDWEQKIFELQSNKIDLIWNGMTITDELKQEIAISDSYLENKQVVVVKAENASKFTDIASVGQAASIAVEGGSAGESTVTDNSYTSKVNKMTAQSDCLLEVKTGSSEIAIIDYTMAKAMTGAGTDYADLTFVDVGYAGEEYGIGMRKEDTDLLKKLNDIIAKYKTDGTLDALTRKYMA